MADGTQNVTTAQLQAALQQLAQGMGLSVKEYVDSLNVANAQQLQDAIANLQGQIDNIVAIDDSDGVETLAEKVQALNELLSADEGQLQQLLDAINSEKSRAQQAEQDLQDAIDAEKSRAQSVEANLQNSINANAQAIQDLQSQIGQTDDGLNQRVTNIENTLNDTTDEDGNTTPGLVTRVGNLETEVENLAQSQADGDQATLDAAKAYTDATVLDATKLDVCAIVNVFRSALELGDTDCASFASSGNNDGGDGDGAVL